MPRVLPRGRVTFAFVDVVESTKTFAAHGAAFVAALAVLQERIARHTEEHGGAVVKTEGDGAFLAFPVARSAVDALVRLQEELAVVTDDLQAAGPRLTVRAGAHTGDAVPVGDDYVALAVNVAARVTSTAGAGQVVVSAATQAELPAPVGVRVGDYDLKDVTDPVELWRVCGDDVPLRGSPSRRTNVRIPVTGFVGRAEELAELGGLVDEHPLITVVGPGGLGKTRLVSELVLKIAAGLKGGAWLTELASLSSGDQVPTAVAEVLGIGSGEIGALAAELRRREDVLLVLDNCEHVLDAVADLIADLQDACPRLRVLCTSREPLQVPGERTWRLGPFVGRAARIELFTQRAWTSGAIVSDDSVPLIDRLCDALDGLPLAIELAATHASSTTLAELVGIAEHGTDDLVRRGGHRRQRSLDAVLAWSLDQLPPERRRSLLVLSVVPGRFDAAMAATILAAVPGCEVDAVRHLARASLVDLDGESYRILDTIRHAAGRRLADDPDLATGARVGLRRWALEETERGFRTPTQWNEVSADAVLALETALEHAVHDDVPRLGKLWERLRAIAYYRDPSQRLVALADGVAHGRLPRDAEEVLSLAGALSIRLIAGLDPLPDERLEEMCRVADGFGTYFAAANLHYHLVFMYAERDDAANAGRHLADYQRYAKSAAAHPLERTALHHLRAAVAAADHDFEASLAHMERELADSRSLDFGDLDLDVCEANVAEALLDLDRPAEAFPHAMNAVRLSTTPGPNRRAVLVTLARTQARLGDTEAALATAREIETELIDAGRSPEQRASDLQALRELLTPSAVDAGDRPTPEMRPRRID